MRKLYKQLAYFRVQRVQIKNNANELRTAEAPN